MFPRFAQKKQCTWKESNIIVCNYGNFGEIPMQITALLKKVNLNKNEFKTIVSSSTDSQNPFQKSSFSLNVNLFNCEYFENNTIKTKWFELESKQVSDINVSPKIIELNIEDKQTIVDIEPDAFNSIIFENMEILRIRKTQITHLRYGIFRGLSKLLCLVLTQMPLTKMAPNFLEPLIALKSLEIEEVNTVALDIRNATGTTKMKTLEHVSFRHNNLCRTINHKTFRGLTSVMRLYVSYSKIQAIASGAFDPIMNSIFSINLNGNLLKSLPNDLFDKLMQVPQPWKVYLADNPWECDCKLSGLKHCIERDKTHFANPIVCYSPQMYHGKFLSQVSMCSCDGNTDERFDIISECSKSGYHQILESYRSDSIYGKSQLISHDQRIEIFHVVNDEDGVSVSIRFTSDSYAVIWFNHEDGCKSSYFDEVDDRCTSVYEKTIKIGNVTQNSTYTFCIVNRGLQMLSPDNCLPYYVSRFDEPTGLHRNAKDFAYIMVTIFLVLIIFALFFGIFFGICLARRYPSFVKSNSSKILIQQIRHNEIWASTNNGDSAEPQQQAASKKRNR